MEDTTSLIPLIYPQLFEPVLATIGKTSAANAVQNKLLAAEKSAPGTCLDLLIGILRKSEVNCNVHEVILRHQVSANGDEDSDLSTIRLSRGQESVRQLIRQLTHLKRVLASIPDQINVDRTTFLETIKATAGSIKAVLDTIEAVSVMLPNPSARSLLDLQKREFVKYSKRFSMTLQGYFRDGMQVIPVVQSELNSFKEKPVYVSALLIINQANVIILTMKQL